MEICELQTQKYKESQRSNRIFYFAIPPNVFVPVASNINSYVRSTTGFNRVIIEKPFGRDLDSADLLQVQIGKLFTENEVYRIDHYLGKEMVQNLMILRFANRIFEPLWNHHHITAVVITFKEDFGTLGRGGYFDSFGIIRDVMQNHLLQILSLVAMEEPVSLGAEDIRDEKVKLLRAISPIRLEDVVIGQYGPDKEGKETGYLDDPTVPKGSITPTYAVACLHIKNTRWTGTPFLLKCGKALDNKKAEIRIQFKNTSSGLFPNSSRNELVLRVQPNESIWWKLITKEPGLKGGPVDSELGQLNCFKITTIAVLHFLVQLLIGSCRLDRIACCWSMCL
jgi:glucose-6-phosphate 1-dehydrogenase